MTVMNFLKNMVLCGSNEDDEMDEAEYLRDAKLNLAIMRGDVKKSKVYVRDPKTKNIKKVNFGDPNMKIKCKPARRRSCKTQLR